MEHHWHISHTGKSGVADYSINLSHDIHLHNTITLSSKFLYVDSINSTAIQNKLQPNSITGR
jgi:hypothetical protein